MRLIDADTLKENIRKNYVICTVGHYFDDLFQDFYNAIDEQPTIDAVPTEFVMENCNLEFVCDALTDEGEWCSEHCQYSEPQPECIHRYIDRIWRTEHDRKAIDEEIERAWKYAETD